MIYMKELVHHKKTCFDHPPGLQVFRDPRENARIFTFEKMLCSTIHGVEYLWEPYTRKSVRIFWLLVTMTSLGACFAMYSILTERHHKQILTTVVETTKLPIYNIYFPSVAVCPWNRVNWIRYEAAQKKFLPQNADKNVKALFYDLLAVMERTAFTLMEPLEELTKHKSLPPAIRDIVLYDLMNFVAFRCDELFVSCVYDMTPQDCCKLFVTERTEKGICLVFNSLISDDSKIKKLKDTFYPRKARSSGEGTGLVFTLRYNKTLQRPGSKVPFSFSLYIKEAEEWSESINHYLLPNTRNYFYIVPRMTEASPSTRSVNPQRRRCLFSDEDPNKYDHIPGLPFNKQNCQTRCQQNYVLRYCGCNLSMFFPTLPNDPHRECKVADLKCLYEHRDIFNYVKYPQQDEFMTDLRRGMVCNCVDNCKSLIFLVSPNTNVLPNPNTSIPEIQANIYTDKNVMTKYGTRLDYTTMDLLANFGGVLGLSLGASVLSLFAVIYRTIGLIFVWIIRKWKKQRHLSRVHIVKPKKAETTI